MNVPEIIVSGPVVSLGKEWAKSIYFKELAKGTGTAFMGWGLNSWDRRGMIRGGS